MSKIDTKLKSLILHLKFAEKLTKKKSYVAKCTFRGRESYFIFPDIFFLPFTCLVLINERLYNANPCFIPNMKS